MAAWVKNVLDTEKHIWFPAYPTSNLNEDHIIKGTTQPGLYVSKKRALQRTVQVQHVAAVEHGTFLHMLFKCSSTGRRFLWYVFESCFNVVLGGMVKE